MKYKIYWCKDCKIVTKDQTECVVCEKTQLELGWIETTEEWGKWK